MCDGVITRDSAEYKTALEIELWKEIKQQEFDSVLKKKELHLLAECSSAFKSEHAKHESEIRSLKKTYDQIMKQYKEKLLQLEKREKKLVQDNKSFKQTIQTFEHDKCLKLDDIKQKTNFRSDFLSLELESMIQKIDSSNFLSQKLSKRLENLETAIIVKEEEISMMNSKMTSQSLSASDHESLLSSKLELSNMNDYLAKLSVSKEKYKLKLQSVLNEVSKMKHMQIPMKSEIKLHEKERPSAFSYSIHSGSNPLSISNLKTEIDGIIAAMSQEKANENDRKVQGDIETDIAKLISERNTLLNTGVYLSNDFIIQQIDEKIKNLLDIKGKS